MLCDRGTQYFIAEMSVQGKKVEESYREDATFELSLKAH